MNSIGSNDRFKHLEEFVAELKQRLAAETKRADENGVKFLREREAATAAQLDREEANRRLSEASIKLAEETHRREDAEHKCYKYCLMVGAALSGTDEARRIADASPSPHDAWGAVMRVLRERNDALITAMVKPLRDELANRDAYVAEMEAPK